MSAGNPGRTGADELSDGWSEPRIYGSPMPVPGDSSVLAVQTAQSSSSEAWSTPIYHGPRRFRPRPEHALRVDPGSARLVAEPAESATGTESPAELPQRPAEALSVSTGPVTARPDGHAGPATDEPPATVTAAAAPEQPEEAAPSLLASSRTMALASLVSRATGFLRTMAIGAALGSGANRIADAYNLGNTLPNMVYELLLGGVLTSVIIPVLVKAQQDDEDRGEAYTQRLLSLAVIGLGVTTLLAVLAAPLLIALYSGDHAFHALATLWATLLLPEIFFYGVGAMLAAILNTKHVYGWPAWAPVANNVITIAAAALFLLVPGPANLTTASISNSQVLVLGIGTTLGIVAQALLLFIPLRRIGFRWAWRFRASSNETGRMAEFRALTLWVLGYVAISQVGVYVIGRVATGRASGLTIFTNADLLFQVPYGIVGVSLLTALMPRMSRAAAQGRTEDVLDDLRLGTRLSAVGLVPITAGLIVLGPTFTSVILLGRFDLSGARLVGIALAAGAFGLLPFALLMLQQRVFYAMRDARTPTFMNLATVGTKIVLVLLASVLLHGRAVIIALTVSTSASYLAGAVVGHVMLRRRFGRLGFAPVLRNIALIAAASAAGAVVALVIVLGGSASLGIGRVASLGTLLVAAATGGAVLVLVAIRLPLPEVASIVDAVRRRSGSRRPGSGEG
ncbi:MAG TPA: murein biosynthesis integral membrane protein MurJ [Jatrophihabitans sp.]|nr:murein biosynthesis integral membrane protein MurJ [Jatrophihabitans sp.]